MSGYQAPVEDLQFVLEALADLPGIARLPGLEEATPDLVQAVLSEAGRLASEVLAPLDEVGDRAGAELVDGAVRTAPGWRDAYRLFAESGWNGVALPVEYGGQGLPELVAAATGEIWNGANMAFALCPMLTHGAVEALLRHGSAEQQQRFLPKMVSGEWTGTMNLTEPQAGSDLSAVRTRAVPEGDHYRLKGQKIFITYGEHDLAENIIHMVLARTPDAPEGVKGISLFIVPKFLVNEDGSLGARNDVHCVSLEHKLGIHASPTAVMAYGENDGAVGYLVGEEHQGLRYMFTMMNLARHAVGVQGVGIAERAWQRARAYAAERVQGFLIGERGGERVTIDRHPDVRRMLAVSRACIEAMRALACVTAAAFDRAAREPDEAARARARAFGDFFTPVVKGWCTEWAVDITSQALQVHGGMGYIEETGAARHFRDARITPIYEGTTGIQANDFIGRKTARDEGATAQAVIGDIRAVATRLTASDAPVLNDIGRALTFAVAGLEGALAWLLDAWRRDPKLAAAVSVPYLMLWGTAAGGWQMARAAEIAHARLAAGEGDAEFLRRKLATARLYALHVLPEAQALARVVSGSAEAILDA